MSRYVILDSEAVQALDPAHSKHRRVLSHIQVAAGRKRRSSEVDVAVPTTVRVEAGWDRTSPRWAYANRFRIRDLVLGKAEANVAAGIRHASGVSVADAHIGAAIRSAPHSEIAVLTSDPEDVAVVAGGTTIRIVAL